MTQVYVTNDGLLQPLSFSALLQPLRTAANKKCQKTSQL